jgi:hypothetical protein
MISYIKGGMQAKGVRKQDPETNIWAQECCEWGVEKTPQWGTICTVAQIIKVIKSTRLRWPGHVARMEEDKESFQIFNR